MRAREYLVLLAVVSPVQSPVPVHGRHSINLMSESMNLLVCVIKKNHCITDIYFLFGWSLAVHQQVFIEPI